MLSTVYRFKSYGHINIARTVYETAKSLKYDEICAAERQPTLPKGDRAHVGEGGRGRETITDNHPGGKPGNGRQGWQYEEGGQRNMIRLLGTKDFEELSHKIARWQEEVDTAGFRTELNQADVNRLRRGHDELLKTLQMLTAEYERLMAL